MKPGPAFVCSTLSKFAILPLLLLAMACTRKQEAQPATVAVDADQNYFLIPAGKGFGFIDRTGRVVIPPDFEQVRPFYEQLAAAKSKGKWGFINSQGKFSIPARYGDVGDFHEGRAAFSEGGLFGFLDSKGGTAIPARFNHVEAFQDGRAKVQIQNQFTYVDAQGNDPMHGRLFALADNFSQGFALVADGNNRFFVDIHGQTVIRCETGVADSGFWTDLAAAADPRTGSMGYIDKSGRFAIAPVYQAAWMFSDGLGLVRQNGLYGYINPQGSIVISPRYEEASSFFEGRAAAGQKRKFGYVDHNGTLVVPMVYDRALSFVNGLAWVEQGREGIYIDAQGRWVWNGELPAWWIESRPENIEEDLRPAGFGR